MIVSIYAFTKIETTHGSNTGLVLKRSKNPRDESVKLANELFKKYQDIFNALWERKEE